MKYTALTAVVLLLSGAALPAQTANLTVISGATLIDGTGGAPLRDAVIVIDGGRIRQVGARATTSVPSAATVIDARGAFVIPGLADMHNHLLSGSTRPQQDSQLLLRRQLAVGVTTVFDPSISLADFSRLKAVASADTSAFARFFSTGPIVTVKGDFFGSLVGSPTPENAAQAQAAVRDLKAAGVDAVKVELDDLSWATKNRMPLMPLDVLTAIVAEAHRQGLKVFAHAPILQQAKAALGAGVDGLMHGIIDEPVDAAFIDLMKKNRAVYVPTLALFEDVADVAAWAKRQAPHWDKAGLQPPALYDSFTSREGVQQFESIFDNTAFTKAHLAVSRANVKRVHDAGIAVVLGTDTGFFGVLFGVATHLELQLLVEAGLTPYQAIQAATINAARMIGREKDLGTIEAGKVADLVILDADPLVDVRNTASIRRVMKGGVFYEPVDPARPIK